MQTRRLELFTTIHTEGAILPVDILQRILDGDSNIDGTSPESYHLGAGEKINEAVNRSWNRLQGLWLSFQNAKEKLPATDAGTSLTRDKWLLQLFQELGYGRLQTGKAIEHDNKLYAISHQWKHTLIHLVSFKLDLDKRLKSATGASKSSPHSLVQELLNASDDHLWGFVSNGLRLRILRDSKSLTRQSYVEFDIEGMMNGEVYSDFVLLWMLCHQSRVEADKPEECWLEKWSQTAQEQGTRALDQLRNGVEHAIQELGQGFLSHTSNMALREKLKSGALPTQEYYRQLFRLVYRLLFLFVAEDRDLLLHPKAEPENRERYNKHYSLTRLRRMASKLRGSKHVDAWEQIRIVMDILSGDTGYESLGLPALGGYLFSDEAIPDLHDCDIPNHDFLTAVRSLAFIVDKGTLRPVDYKNLRSEEFGSVYESLLELHPVINADAGTFDLKTAGGNERKTTASYYTHDSLVQCLLDSALDPVIEEAVKKADPEKAILALKVCDFASGSGHFLTAAAHRMAKRLAAIRTEEEEPAPEAIRTALRDVIGHCIYGVDINPMAVELCKVALWMEALEAGKPLSFLDHHIQCGNSLIGATPALLKKGIPDEAFSPIEGDDKKVCQEYKKRNKQEREKLQTTLFDMESKPWMHLGNLTTALIAIDSISDATVDGVKQKQKQYEEFVRSTPSLYGKFLADVWCAAFVWKKTNEFPYPITEEVFRNIEKNPFSAPIWLKEEVERLAKEYQFFHWHLAYPDVFRVDGKITNESDGLSGGFNLVLGNPPWEKVQPEEKQFFAGIDPSIAYASSLKRKQSIDSLKDAEPRIFSMWLEYKRSVEAIGLYARGSAQFEHSAKGNINLAYLFAEFGQQLIRKYGKLGLLVPSGIATNDLSKEYFTYLVESKSLVQVVDFENRAKLFPAVDERFRFSLVIICKMGEHLDDPEFAFFLQTPNDIRDRSRFFTLNLADLKLLNPTTCVSPIFRSKKDAEIAKDVYRRIPILLTEMQNKWSVRIFTEMFNLTRSMEVLYTSDDLESMGFQLRSQNVYQKSNDRYLPVLEGKMITQYNHRASTIVINPENLHRPAQTVDATSESLANHEYYPMPQFWTSEKEYLRRRPAGWKFKWYGGYKRVTSQSNFRTFVGCILPDTPSLYSISLVLPNIDDARLALCLFANLWSCPFDYLVRQKTSQPSLPQNCVEQTPVIPPEHYNSKIVDLIAPCVLELSYTAWDLQPFAQDCGYDGPPFIWDEERRFLLRAELDAAYFHLYGISRDDVDYIMETFPIVKRKDEAKYGEYKTKVTILKMYDEMKAAMESGGEYQTWLDPPPADVSVAHPLDRKNEME